jgi:hypothetical protein
LIEEHANIEEYLGRTHDAFFSYRGPGWDLEAIPERPWELGAQTPLPREGARDLAHL